MDGVIDLWPGIIKASPKGSGGYLVTLIGNTHDVFISLYAMVPYQAFRADEAMLRKLQPPRRKCVHTTLLNLEEYAEVEMDDDRFSTVSLAFSFAIAFSAHLATAWSWSANPDAAGSRPVKYALRSQTHKEKRYDVLWWGPECIEERQLVRLKMTSGAIFTDPNSPTVPALANYPVGPDQPLFLQVHSIFYHQKRGQGRERLGPVVAGSMFDLVDENQYGARLLLFTRDLFVSHRI